MIDTHAHLNFDAFKNDFRKVIERSKERGMSAIINVGANFDTSEEAVKIAQKSKMCYASVGIHPIHVQDVADLSDREIASKLLKFATEEKVVAIGETGLDYYHLPSEASGEERRKERKRLKKAQKRLFKVHLRVAQRKNFPIILHCRDAYRDMLSILEAEPRQSPGVIHCFCGDVETVLRFLKRGFYIGFTGMVTYPGNEYLGEVIKNVPLDKILVETDCPFLPPQQKGGERNEPSYVRYVIEYVAKTKGKSLDEVEKFTSANAEELFSLKL